MGPHPGTVLGTDAGSADDDLVGYQKQQQGAESVVTGGQVRDSVKLLEYTLSTSKIYSFQHVNAAEIKKIGPKVRAMNTGELPV